MLISVFMNQYPRFLCVMGAFTERAVGSLNHSGLYSHTFNLALDAECFTIQAS